MFVQFVRSNVPLHLVRARSYCGISHGHPDYISMSPRNHNTLIHESLKDIKVKSDRLMSDGTHKYAIKYMEGDEGFIIAQFASGPDFITEVANKLG